MENNNKFNKSLSARIRRRNQCGFNGTGNYNGINDETHTYGNYNDPKDNHKDKNKNNYQKELIKIAKLAHSKHPGSKTIKKLKLYNQAYKNYKQEVETTPYSKK